MPTTLETPTSTFLPALGWNPCPNPDPEFLWEPDPSINPPLERMLAPRIGDRVFSEHKNPPPSITGVVDGVVRLSNGATVPLEDWPRKVCITISHRCPGHPERRYIPVEGYKVAPHVARRDNPQVGDEVVMGTPGLYDRFHEGEVLRVVGRHDDEVEWMWETYGGTPDARTYRSHLNEWVLRFHRGGVWHAAKFVPVEARPLFAGLRLAKSLRKLLEEFAADCPCCRMVLRAYSVCKFRTPRFLNPNLPGNFFAFRESEGQVTYCPTGKEQVINPDGTWARKGRQGMKPAKWLRAMLHPRLAKRIPDHVFARFSERFRAAEEAHRVRFEFVSFAEAYCEDNFEAGINSCMWNEPVEEFYEYFPCRALVATRNGKFIGRAIVWDDVEGLSVPFMDRVYAVSPEITELFLDYAKEQGWAHKQNQNNRNLSGVVMPDGTVRSMSMHVESTSTRVTHNREMFYPYLDTFPRMDCDGTLYNDECEGYGGWLLRNTDGSREEIDPHDGQVQDVDGEWINEDDAVYVERDYYHVNDERIVWCDRSREFILRSSAWRVTADDGTEYVVHDDYVNDGGTNDEGDRLFEVEISRYETIVVTEDSVGAA